MRKLSPHSSKLHDEWRLIREPFVGKINALPNLFGMALATNGIDVVVVCDQTAFIGHLEFFVGETSVDETLKQHAIVKKQTNKPPKPHFDISMFA